MQRQTYVTDVVLAERYSVHRSTIWRWVQAGLLPRPVQLSPGCTRWRLDEIERREADLEATRGRPLVAVHAFAAKTQTPRAASPHARAKP